MQLRIGSALARDIWAHAKWRALILALCVAAWIILTGLIVDRTVIGRRLGVLTIFFQFFFVVGLIGHTFVGVKGDRVGFPVRLFTMPARTRALVTWQMGLALLGNAVLYLATAAFAFLIYGEWQPIGSPLLNFSIVVAWLLMVAWVLPDMPQLRSGLLFFLVLLGIAGLIFMQVDFHGDPTFRIPWLGFSITLWNLWEPPPLRAYAFAICGVALAWAGSVARVARDRRGAAQGIQPLRAVFQNWRQRGKVRATWRSGAAAYFWFEWRRKGWIIPVLHVLVIVIISIVAYSYERGIEILIPGVYVLMVTGTPVFGFFGGAYLGQLNVSRRIGELDLFRATRPLSDREMAMTTLRVGLLSLLAGWAIDLAALLLFAGILEGSGHGDLLAKLWFGELNGGAKLWEYVSHTVIMLFAAWIIQSSVVALIMAGRGKLIIGLLMAIVGAASFLFGVESNFHGETAQYILKTMIIILGSALLIAAITGVLMAGARRLVSGSFLSCSALAMAAIATVVMRKAAIPNQWDASETILALGFFVLAAATPSLATLAMAWNRHR